MELLIPGLVLVALMVYASTRIKRSAARAFEAESIDTPEMFISKPDGFLHVIDDHSPLLFEAYSKEFGTGSNGSVRRVTAAVTRRDEDTKTLAESIRTSAGSLHDDHSDGNCTVIGSNESIGDSPYSIYYKICPIGDGSLELKVVALSDTHESQREKISELIDSFYSK